ncbi:unnamed protein product [Calicophoron daubneyi]|uniref:Solute carrier family 35 member F6 n=1 Tax=Calicophoron daubneyi TaxID=300641 RepID=A0AAV2TWW8_CALDB
MLSNIHPQAVSVLGSTPSLFTCQEIFEDTEGNYLTGRRAHPSGGPFRHHTTAEPAAIRFSAVILSCVPGTNHECASGTKQPLNYRHKLERRRKAGARARCIFQTSKGQVSFGLQQPRHKFCLFCILNMSSTKRMVLVAAMLFTGTINTVSKKMQLDCKALGYYDHSKNDTRTLHEFSKPWFQTLLMFLGEFLCIFGFIAVRYRKRQRMVRDGTYRELSEGEPKVGIVHVPIFSWVFAIPAALDLLGSTLAGIGLLFIDASIWQMIRGSLIIFAGLLSICFLKRRLYCFHWTGLLITVVGLAVVGAKSVFSSSSLENTGAKSALGVFLVLLSGLIAAFQMIVEELVLKKRGFHPLQTVAMEGLFGSVMMIAIALPVVHFLPGSDLNGSYENQIDALYQIRDSALLIITTIVYVLSISFFNYCGLSITRYLSAVHRTLIDALRTAFVWGCGLILFYAFGQQWGEPFDFGWGLVQIDGFVLLVIGTLIYNRVMDLSFIPWCRVPSSPPPDSGVPRVIEETLPEDDSETDETTPLRRDDKP